MLSLLYGTNLISIHDYWENYSFDYRDFCRPSKFLLFNMLSRFVIAFLPRSKHLLISWQQSGPDYSTANSQGTSLAVQ